MARMVAENEIRSDISPWEKGRLVVQAVDEEIFDTLDAAVNGLYPTLDRDRRRRIRAVAEVVSEIGDNLLSFPETLSHKQLTRIAAAIRHGLGDLIQKALHSVRRSVTRGPVERSPPILDEADHEARNPRTGYRPGRPRRMIQPRRNLWIRREKTPRAGTSASPAPTPPAR
jgi:ParB family transcriptional regulator, chromosome partitioning protein